MEGWIKLHRKVVESAVFRNPNLFQVFMYCLTRANHKEVVILFDGGEITLRPGQFITGRFEGAKDCNMKPSTFRNQLKKLREMRNLDIESDNKKSIITIVKWEQYQGADKIMDSYIINKKTTSGQQMDTDKNVKNEKNEKNLAQDFSLRKNQNSVNRNWRYKPRSKNEKVFTTEEEIQKYFSRKINEKDYNELNNIAEKYGIDTLNDLLSKVTDKVRSTKIWTDQLIEATFKEINYRNNVLAEKKNEITKTDLKNQNFLNLVNDAMCPSIKEFSPAVVKENQSKELRLIETIYKEKFNPADYADKHALG